MWFEKHFEKEREGWRLVMSYRVHALETDAEDDMVQGRPGASIL